MLISRSNVSTAMTEAERTTADCRSVQFGSGGVTQLAGEAGHGVNMTRRHPPSRQGVMHLGQLRADRGPPSRGVSLTGRAPPTAGQQGRGRLTRPFGGEPGSVDGDTDVEGVQPGPHPLRQRHQRSETSAVTGRRVGVGELADQCHDSGVVHTFSIRTYVLKVKGYLDGSSK